MNHEIWIFMNHFISPIIIIIIISIIIIIIPNRMEDVQNNRPKTISTLIPETS